MKRAISFHDFDAVEGLRRRCGLDPEHLRRARTAFYKKHEPRELFDQGLPDAFRSEVETRFLELAGRQDSRTDGASKLLFRTSRGQTIETVLLRIASGRTSLCVSSQVGCAVHCAFCATGRMGAVVDLSRDEILDQLIWANRLAHAEGRAVRNVVFMGMGEPLHNEAEVRAALDRMLSPNCFDLSPARVLVSTVGIPDAMIRFAEKYPRVGLAVSLHAARQDRRERLIPLARRHDLGELRIAMTRVNALQSRPLMIEYLLLEDRNDSEDDIVALVEYLTGLRVHVNLIPYNSVDSGLDLRGSPSPRREAIAQRLKDAGFRVTMRYSLGGDIAAACGQLATREAGKA